MFCDSHILLSILHFTDTDTDVSVSTPVKKCGFILDTLLCSTDLGAFNISDIVFEF